MVADHVGVGHAGQEPHLGGGAWPGSGSRQWAVGRFGRAWGVQACGLTLLACCIGAAGCAVWCSWSAALVNSILWRGSVA